MEQKFKLGQIAYMLDEDFKRFEEKVYKIELIEIDGIKKIEYSTSSTDFKNEDIGNWVFTSEMLREETTENIPKESAKCGLCGYEIKTNLKEFECPCCYANFRIIE